VETTVQPWVEFADPVDGTSPATSAAAAATAFVKLETETGAAVPGHVEVEGWRVRFVPDAPLSEGGAYVFRVLAGLPFQSGGALEAERRSRFQVAARPVAAWPATAQMQVQLSFPPGSPPKPLPLVLRATPPSAASEPLRVVVVPTALGNQQRQPVWVRLDGDRLLMAPLALPVTPTAVANASRLIGRVTKTDGGVVRAVEGTLRLTGPGIDVPDVPFTIEATP
jgi:hypothetical protein